ncbi:MAG: OmpA family protein [Bacteroidales bacterium]|nr:OmpA family protein [Candidatus Physcousia equi]
MKKFMMLLAFAGLSFGASAQETSYPTKKHQIVTNSFWSNWFIDAGFDWNAFYSSQEHLAGPTKNKSPFWMGRRSMGADLSIGKWVTPAFGMRLKGNGIWGTQVNSRESGTLNPTFTMWTLSLQPMVNLNNLFCGYKPRVWNISIYGGFGVANYRGGRTDYQKSEENAGGLEEANRYSWLGTIGVLNTFNITKRFHINLDVSVNAGEADLDGNTTGGDLTRVIKTRDNIVDFSLGLGVNLGKVGWDNAPDVDAIMAMNQAQLDALNAALADAEAENARLKAQIANHKCPKGDTRTITEFASTSASVFFNINQTTIASKKDLVNVKEIAELAKSKGATVVVAGYADSKTGSASRNQALSEGRANAVKKELIKMGVAEDKIETVAKGGVADLEPFTYNRRAVVTLK